MNVARGDVHDADESWQSTSLKENYSGTYDLVALRGRRRRQMTTCWKTPKSPPPSPRRINGTARHGTVERIEQEAFLDSQWRSFKIAFGEP